MSKKYIIVTCPFCKKGNIEASFFPSTVKYVKATYGGSKATIERSAEDLIVTTEKCQVCGKLKKELEIKLKKDEINDVSHSERLKRLRESGLPTIIVSSK